MVVRRNDKADPAPPAGAGHPFPAWAALQNLVSVRNRPGRYAVVDPTKMYLFRYQRIYQAPSGLYILQGVTGKKRPLQEVTAFQVIDYVLTMDRSV